MNPPRRLFRRPPPPAISTDTELPEYLRRHFHAQETGVFRIPKSRIPPPLPPATDKRP